MEIIDVREAEDINMDMFDDDQQMIDMESVNITGQQRQRQCQVQHFGAGLVHSNETLNNNQKQQYLQQAFNFFDKDNSGYITKDNLGHVIKEYASGDIGEVQDEVIGYIIDQVDMNKDGRIDLMEFLRMMLNQYEEDQK